jgi:S-ribosylhomocysteine lyase LuxS involved in autoinducer biosynthesis
MSAAGLSLLLLAAEAATPAASAAAQPPPQAAPAPAASSEPCKNRQEREGDIIICAERPNGYRLDPDVQEAKRELKRQKLRRPENFVHNDCATVGPMGCRGGPYINLLAAAATAAEMAKRVAEGKEIGSMFQTTPEPTEYDLYKAAKAQREAKEAAAKAKAKAKAAPVAPATPPPQADPPQPSQPSQPSRE